MLRITIHDSAAECRFQLAGRLEGAGVAELEQSWQTARSTTAGRRTTLDLRGLEGADDGGRALLDRMFAAGVTEAIPVPPGRTGRRRRIVAAALAPLLSLLCPALAAGAEPVAARQTLDQYLSTAGAPPEPESGAVNLEIRARLGRRGRSALARVVETVSAGGRAVFRLTAFDGDETVKRQVIARYLTAEAEARLRRDGSLAVTAANYRFHFLRSAESDGTPAFVYRLDPRKKRPGLFRGELWLASGSARVLRQSGRMAKSPSIFIRRLDFVRDFDRGGSPRSLDVKLETRIAGAAELNVRYESVAETEAGQ